MVDSLYLITDPTQLSLLENKIEKSNNGLLVSFSTSEISDKIKIESKHADEFLSKEERLKIFDKTISLYNWYEQDRSFDIFNFQGINLLGFLDTAEFHQFVLEKIKIFVTIKNILNQTKPKKIFAPKFFSEAISSIIKTNDVELTWLNIQTSNELYWDKINFKFNILSKPMSLDISRKNFYVLKNLFENFVSTFFGINKLDPKKKSLLFLEFDPINYEEIFKNLQDYDGQIIMYNNRRPLIYNFETLKNCREVNYKILTKESLSNSNLKILEKTTKKYLRLFEQITDNEKIRTIFSIDDISFWSFIKNPLFNTLKNRLGNYLENLLISKEFLENFDVRCIISTNVVGETEKIVLKTNQNLIPSIMLEHAYANYVPEISRYDILSMYPLFKDKIAVWGNVQKNYLIDQHNMDSKKILEIGSPRHDSFFIKKIKKMNNVKTVLVTIHPISNVTGMATFSLRKKFEKSLSELIRILKSNQVKIIIKLHPSQIEHNREIEQIIGQIDPNITIHQTIPIKELLPQSNFLINISSEGYDPSTVLLESMILKIPSTNIIMDNEIYDFQFLKDDSVFTVIPDDQFEQNINNFLNNSTLQKKLITNGIKHVEKYLVNPGTASRHFSSILKNF